MCEVLIRLGFLVGRGGFCRLFWHKDEVSGR